MNMCIFTAVRLSRDPEITMSQNNLAIARFSIAINRMKTQSNPNPGADFVNCIAFGKRAEFIEKYLKKGDKVNIQSHVQTGSYDSKEDGHKIYTTDFIIDTIEFCESKQNSNQNTNQEFMNVPDTIQEELPFN